MPVIQKNEREKDGKVYEQYTVTIPRKLAKSKGWNQGTKINFQIIGSGEYTGQLRIEEAEE